MKNIIAMILILTSLCFSSEAQILICPGASNTITSSISGANYQWQIDSGNGFKNLQANAFVSGITTNIIQLNSIPSSWYNFQFRCKVGNEYSEITSIQFKNTWIGLVSSDFENAANWSCGAVPDANSDVMIDNDTVNLATNKTIRSLILKNSAKVNLPSGVTLNISGKQVLLNDFNLTLDDIEFLDSITIAAPAARGESIATGSGDLSPRGLLIDTLLERARRLCMLKNTTYTSDTGAINLPLTYKGMAYSYGSRQVDSSAKPKSGDVIHKRYSVFGTDCSGMMIILLKGAKISINENTSTVTFESQLREALTNTGNIYFPTVRVLNFDSLPESKVLPGDFMLWKEKRHIGIIQQNGAQKILYQSNGNPSPLTEQGWKTKPVNNVGGVRRNPFEEQALNWGAKRGATVKDFSTAVFSAGYWGTKYKILRLIEVYSMTNTPQFTTNNFSAIQFGKGGYIYAGTANQGIYMFNGYQWSKLPILTNNNILHLQRDKNEGIWIAQSGNTGSQALTGGVGYLPDTTTTGYTYYGATLGLPTRNCRSIFIDTTRFHVNTNPRIWTANMADVTGGVSNTGAVGLGLNSASPFFAKITKGIETTNGLGSVQCIGGNNLEVWAFASVNFGRSQIRRYDAATGDSIVPIGAYDYFNTPNLTSNFTARAIYFDKSDKRWIGFTAGGVVVKNGNVWTTVNLPELFPTGTLVNTNAITGNNNGEVFIGTTTGLIIYNGVGALDNLNSYKKLTNLQGLPSSNVKAICYDKDRQRLILGTDAGIAVIKYL